MYEGVLGPFKEPHFEWFEDMTLTLSFVHKLVPPAGVCVVQGSRDQHKTLSRSAMLISSFPYFIHGVSHYQNRKKRDVSAILCSDNEPLKDRDPVLFNNVRLSGSCK